MSFTHYFEKNSMNQLKVLDWDFEHQTKTRKLIIHLPMFSIIFSDKAIHSVFAYIDMYEDVQVKRFENSWLWCEDIIIENYKKRSEELFLLLESHIIRRLSGETVLGYREDPENIWQAVLVSVVDDYTLIIDYFEDSPNHTRTILSIRIFRD